MCFLPLQNCWLWKESRGRWLHIVERMRGCPVSLGGAPLLLSHVLSVHFPLTFLPHHYSGAQNGARCLNNNNKKQKKRETYET